MNISVHEWVIIIGGLLVVAVLLDAYRRRRKPPKRRRSRVPPRNRTGGEDGGEDKGDFFLNSELPGGGARVIERGPGETPDGLADGDSSQEPDRESAAGVDRRDSTPNELDFPEPDPDPEPDPKAQDPEVFMLHVVARDETGFGGEDILHALLSFEMRFGDMRFFHRHEFPAGRGEILFSVANMVQPGVFDIDTMSELSTPGLSFFATMPGPLDMGAAFDLMAETARGVAEQLGGDLLDETRSATTKQTLEHMRQRIRDLKRQMPTGR